jgi:hypothetical protein
VFALYHPNVMSPARGPLKVGSGSEEKGTGGRASLCLRRGCISCRVDASSRVEAACTTTIGGSDALTLAGTSVVTSPVASRRSPKPAGPEDASVVAMSPATTSLVAE